MHATRSRQPWTEPDNLYERVRRTVTTAAGPVAARTYVAGELLDVASLPELPSGDWFAR